MLDTPTGGSVLTDAKECKVTVTHDLLFGRISFLEGSAEVKQSAGKLVLPLQRKGYMKGKVRVPWSAESADEQEGPYKDLTGIETFEDGEEKSNIEIMISQIPRKVESDTFDVVLATPKTTTIKRGDISKCTVTVLNDKGW